MGKLFQRMYHTTARLTEKGLLVETIYCDSVCDTIIVRLQVDKSSFVIIDAVMEIQKRDRESQVRTLSELKGITAYLGSGNDVKNALSGIVEPIVSNIVNEAIGVVIQTEVYFVKERGYTTKQELDIEWDKMCAGSCYLFSNLDKINREYSEDTPNKEGCLFVRVRTFYLLVNNTGTYQIVGNMYDHFHEMNTTIEISGGRITRVNGDMCYIHHELCKGSIASLTNLAGLQILSASKREIANLCGNGLGCTHLITLVDDSIKMFKNYINKV